MGTSTSYPGPTGRNPLLPPWADEQPFLPPDEIPYEGDEESPADDADAADEPQDVGPRDGATPPEPLVSWRAPKSTMTRWVRGSGPASLGSVARSYVGASGGPRGASAASRQGRAATARIGGFLADGLRNGFAKAARNLGLQNFVGRDAQFVLASFIDLLAPVGALREDAVARKAVIETMSELFGRFDVETNGLDSLDSLDPAGMLDLVQVSVTNYVNERFQQELIFRIEQGAISEGEANDLSAEVKGFIASVVRIDLERMDPMALDWQGSQGTAFVERVYWAAYSLFGEAAA